MHVYVCVYKLWAGDRGSDSRGKVEFHLGKPRQKHSTLDTSGHPVGNQSTHDACRARHSVNTVIFSRCMAEGSGDPSRQASVLSRPLGPKFSVNPRSCSSQAVCLEGAGSDPHPLSLWGPFRHPNLCLLPPSLLHLPRSASLRETECLCRRPGFHLQALPAGQAEKLLQMPLSSSFALSAPPGLGMTHCRQRPWPEDANGFPFSFTGGAWKLLVVLGAPPRGKATQAKHLDTGHPGASLIPKRGWEAGGISTAFLSPADSPTPPQGPRC